MKALLEFCPLDPQENELLFEGIKLVSFCCSSHRDIICKLTTYCLHQCQNQEQVSELVRTGPAQIQIKKEQVRAMKGQRPHREELSSKLCLEIQATQEAEAGGLWMQSLP